MLVLTFFLHCILWTLSHGTRIELSDTFGVITSPNYPETYKDNEAITWNITAPKNYQIVIYFSHFYIEDSYDEDMGGACTYDYVKVENVENERKFCGNYKEFPTDAPIPLYHYRSINNSLIIRFVSDYSNEEANYGFVAHYFVDDLDECAHMQRALHSASDDWDQLIYCNHICINLPGSYYCACRHGFELHGNNHTCKASCQNQELSGDEGFIVSPDYPMPYSKLSDCDWTIKVRPGLSLNLQFVGIFQIEDHIEYSDCVYDYLKLEYGENEIIYCHDRPENGSVIQTNVREVHLEFHTDNAIELAGFNMTYFTTRQRCDEIPDAPINGRKSENPKEFYEFEDEILFACDVGYKLIGANVITCQSDGSWNNPAPTCQIKSCGEPHLLLSVSNSHLVYAQNLQFTYGDTITVQCNDWYERTSGLQTWSCSENGQWIPAETGSNQLQIPVCSPICGIKNNARQRNFFLNHISRGDRSAKNEWPWLVFINFGPKANVASNLEICVGALISSRNVLTAAHCISNNDKQFSEDGITFPEFVHVWLGVHNRKDDYFSKKNSTARSYSVVKIIRHPQYNTESQDFDFALLDLNETVTMSYNTRPICLPNTTADFEKMNLGVTHGFVAGWGLSTFSRRSSYVLNQVHLPTVTKETCWNSFRTIAREHSVTLSQNVALTDNMFCAGYESIKAGETCRGDSGGPFMVKDKKSSKYFSYGLVSRGVGVFECGQHATYTVFGYLTPVTTRWIHSNIN